MVQNADVIIVGAGAAGLAAARELLNKGRKIILLEASDRIGGRINTLQIPGFSRSIEAGAEFVHGDLPVTKALLNEANISVKEFSGNSFQVKNGDLSANKSFISNFSLLLSKLNNLTNDMPLSQFFKKYLKDKSNDDLKKTLKNFAEGYDAANIKNLSTYAVKSELVNMQTSEQYYLQNGYSSLIYFLAGKIIAKGGIIKTSTVAKEIHWGKEKVKIIIKNRELYFSKKVLITIPIGVLQSKPLCKGHISFFPELPFINSFESFGYGGVIKIFFEFKEKFWEKEMSKKLMPDLSFIFSDAPIGVWWRNSENISSILTGWLGGPKAKELSKKGNNYIRDKGIDSLAYLFSVSKSFIKEQIIACKIINWIKDPFAKGAYSYATIESKSAREKINKSVENKVYFAGEALDKDETIGTVEAALLSGKSAAKKILTIAR
jgi:monoamine oxidase